MEATTQTPTAATAAAAGVVNPGDYLTDGTRLLHVEYALRTLEGEDLVELEDCGSLDRWVWPVAQLLSRGVRTVVPA